MQSVLQFRRAGHAAAAQLSRDYEKIRSSLGLDFASPQGSSSPPGEDTPTETDISNCGNLVEEVCRSNFQTVPTQSTHYTMGATLARVCTGIQVQNTDQSDEPSDRVFIVDWEGPGDPLNPRNWPISRRVGVTIQISLIALFVGAASGIDATVLPQAADEFRVSDVVESLATGLYLVGMGLGSLVAGPFSETFGRNVVYIASMAIFMIWIMASGLAPNIGAQLVFRFLAGCSASTPLACAGGSIADMYNNIEKAWGFPLYAITCFGGPLLGAVMGAYIGPSRTISWRWVEWTVLIVASALLVLVILLLPETYGPLLLQWKVAHYQKITGDSRFRSEHQVTNATLFSRLKVSMMRPFRMITEPIIAATSAYITVSYIVLFTFLVGWPYIFEEIYGLDQGLANIIFLSMFLGTWMNFVLVPVVYRITMKEIRLSESDESRPFRPEVRLWYSMIGAAAMPVSLFWLAWTSFASISIWSPILAVTLFGFGITSLFLSVNMYIIDSYQSYSASALTFVVLTRYVVAGGMTVVGIPFYKNMGVHYTLTILACLAVVLVPIPYILYYRGHLIRARSKYGVSG